MRACATLEKNSWCTGEENLLPVCRVEVNFWNAKLRVNTIVWKVFECSKLVKCSFCDNTLIQGSRFFCNGLSSCIWSNFCGFKILNLLTLECLQRNLEIQSNDTIFECLNCFSVYQFRAHHEGFYYWKMISKIGSRIAKNWVTFRLVTQNMKVMFNRSEVCNI